MGSTITKPDEIIRPWAENGARNTLAVESQIAITAGVPSYNDGWVPLNSVSPLAGGVAIKRLDFNGLLNAITANSRWTNAGGQARFDSTLAAEIGGYPVGAILQSDDGTASYINVLDGNSTDFNSTPASIGVSWIPYGLGGARVAIAAGSADAITASFTPAITTLTNGLLVYVRAAYANATTAPTFTPNSGTISAATIVKGAGSALVAGDIQTAGYWMVLQYDATLARWVLLNPATGLYKRSWINVTSSRTIGTTYTNTNGHEIHVFVYALSGAASQALRANINGTIIGASTGQQYTGNGLGIYFAVPAESTFLVGASGDVNLQTWFEFR